MFDATTLVQDTGDEVVIDAPAWPWWTRRGTTWRRSPLKGAAILLAMSVPTLLLATRILEFGAVIPSAACVGVVLLLFAFVGVLYVARVSVTFAASGISKRFYVGRLSAPEYTFLRWSKVRDIALAETSAGCGLAAGLKSGRALLVPHMSGCDQDALISALTRLRVGSAAT